jgi:hypothetical protein
MSCFCRYSCTKVQRSMKISGFTLKSSGPVSLGSFKPHMVKLIPFLPNTPCIHCNWCMPQPNFPCSFQWRALSIMWLQSEHFTHQAKLQETCCSCAIHTNSFTWENISHSKPWKHGCGNPVLSNALFIVQRSNTWGHVMQVYLLSLDVISHTYFQWFIKYGH